MKRKMISLIMILALIIGLFPFQVTQAATNNLSPVPIEALKYAYSHYNEVVSDDNNMLCLDKVYTKGKYDRIFLGKPFIIYEPTKKYQDEIYYFPIFNSSNDILMIMSVIGTTEGWTTSFSNEWIDSVETNIDTNTNIYYNIDNTLYSEKKTFLIENKSILSKIVKHTNLSLDRKIDDIRQRLKKVDIDMVRKMPLDGNDTYTPGFSISAKSSKQCSLYNKKSQSTYGLCWAATVATICNYRKGTNISATNVANAMNINYNEGATIHKSQEALSYFGINYDNIINGPNNINSIKTNINNKYPMYIKANSGTRCHAVTLFGYDHSKNEPYVYIWNSGEYNGAGSTIRTKFLTTGTSFSYNNAVFTWKASLSKY